MLAQKTKGKGYQKEGQMCKILIWNLDNGYGDPDYSLLLYVVKFLLKTNQNSTVKISDYIKNKRPLPCSGALM